MPVILAVALGLQLLWMRSTEPYFSGDETRHVMTGIFVHDALRDGAARSPREYAERWYAQYPCLGLMVWPPGFYAVEGAAMLAFGPSHETGRGLVLAYMLVAIAYFHRLVRRTHGEPTAAIAAILLVLSREVFINSRAVMLEVPTLACVLGAIVHFERFLVDRKRRDLVLLAIWTAAAGLHRYDAAFLAPLFLVRLVTLGQLSLLRTRSVVVAVVGILAVLAPVYWLAYQTVGQQHALAAGSGTNPAVVRHGVERWTYYFESLEFQLGIVTAIAGAIGLLASFRRDAWNRSRLYWVILAVVYAFFAVLAEQETRHTIYWLPAWCVFATEAALLPWRLFQRTIGSAAMVAIVVAGTAYWTLSQPVPWVRGYAAAAESTIARAGGAGVVLFDGHFDGTFIYGMRRRDPHRRFWILRGDKLLYAVRSDPGAGYVEWTSTERELTEKLVELAPDFIVVEEPPLKRILPAQVALRKILAERSDLFERLETIPIQCHNIEWMHGAQLAIYRNRNRRAGPRTLTIPMLWGGRDITVNLSE